MPRIATMVLCVLVCLCVRADYRILYMNTPTIEIGGKTMKVKDTFVPDAKIKWTSPKQAIKVLDTKTGEKRVLVADDFSQAKAQSAKAYLDYVRRTKRLSTDSYIGKTAIKSLASYLNDRFYLLDNLEIETGVPTDANHYFFITYVHNGQEITKAVPNDKGVFTLTPPVFSFNGSRPENEVTVKVYYYDKTADRVTPVCTNMRVVILPKKLK